MKKLILIAFALAACGSSEKELVFEIPEPLDTLRVLEQPDDSVIFKPVSFTVRRLPWNRVEVCSLIDDCSIFPEVFSRPADPCQATGLMVVYGDTLMMCVESKWTDGPSLRQSEDRPR